MVDNSVQYNMIAEYFGTTIHPLNVDTIQCIHIRGREGEDGIGAGG